MEKQTMKKSMILAGLLIGTGWQLAAGITAFYPSGNTAGIFSSGEKIELKLKLDGAEKQAEGMIRIKNSDGKTVVEKTVIAPTGSITAITLDPMKMNGFFTAEAVFGDQKAECSLVSTPQLEKRDPFFAIRPFDWQAPEAFPAIQKLGFGAIQVSMGELGYWSNPELKLENLPEVIEKSAYAQRIFRLMKDYDFTYYGVIGLDVYHRTNEARCLEFSKRVNQRFRQGFFCYPDDMYERFEIWVETFQKLTGHKIKYWALVQEIDAAIKDPNRPSRGGAVELAHHVVCARIAYRVLKKLDPSCRVAIMSSCGADFHITQPPFQLTKFILNDLCGQFDIIGLDAYNGNYSLRDGRDRITPPEEGLRKHLLAAKVLSREFGKDGTITVEERSFHLPPHGTPLNSEVSRLLADYTARENIIIKAVTGIPYYCYLDYAYQSDQIMWKALKDENGRQVRSPFPAAAAYATTIRMLSFAEPVRRNELRLPYDIYGYLFRKGGKTILPVWCAGEQPVELEVAMPSAFELTDLNGNTRSVPAGKQIFRLSSSPIFLTLSESPKQIRTFWEKGKVLNRQAVKAEARSGAFGQAMVRLVNQLAEPVTVKIDGLEVKLNPYEKKTVSIPAPAKGQIRLQVGNNSYPVTFQPEIRAVRKAAAGFAMDGRLTKYEASQKIHLVAPRDVYPKSATIPERALLLNDGKDIDVEFYMAWDERHLYLAAKVRDRLHLNRKLGNQLWMGDSMQFAVIKDNQAWSAPFSDAKNQGITLNASLALTDTGVKMYNYMKNIMPDWQGQVRREGFYTIYEVAVPWSDLGVIKPAAGMVFGLNAVFFDLNKPGEERSQHWAAVSEGLAGKVEPEKFKTFQLTE